VVWQLEKSTFWEKTKHQFYMDGKNHGFGEI
jgi:hypothetical protein